MLRSTGQTNHTAAQMLSDMSRVSAEVGPEPIGEWMRAQGVSPEWWILVLPARLRELGLSYPEYVRFSHIVESPMFMHKQITLALQVGN